MRLVDYVVAHELVHLRHPNHTREFWAALGQNDGDDGTFGSESPVPSGTHWPPRRAAPARRRGAVMSLTPSEREETLGFEVSVYENDELVQTTLFETLGEAEMFAENWTDRVARRAL